MYNQKEFIEKLLTLMKENPDLPVKCMVDSDIIAEDGYAWWLGVLDYNTEPEVREYSIEIEECITFKDEEDWSYWFDRLNLEDTYLIRDVPEDELDVYMEICVNKEVKWEEAIFVKVTV